MKREDRGQVLLLLSEKCLGEVFSLILYSVFPMIAKLSEALDWSHELAIFSIEAKLILVKINQEILL